MGGLARITAVLMLGAAGLGCSGAPVTVADGDGGPGVDGGAGGQDGSTTGTVDASVFAEGGSPSDAGPGGTTAAIACGNASCALPASACCVYTSQNPPPPFTYVCSPQCPQAPGSDGLAQLKCSGAANCPSTQVCCVSRTNTGSASECKAACTGNDAQLCDPRSAQAGCPANAPCSSDKIGDWRLPPTFGTCGGRVN